MPNLRIWRLLALLLLVSKSSADPIPWLHPHHYRAVLDVDTQGQLVSNARAQLDLDLQTVLGDSGKTLDPDSLAVYATTEPTLRLPHRLERYFGMTQATLHFVIPNSNATNVLVYFDTIDPGLGHPADYAGLIGDGDRFVEIFQRRNIAPTHFDQLVDFDGDGDLDLFQGGVESFVYCYENVGANHMVARGKLSSAGQPLQLPASESNRSWVTVCFQDMDGDGDQDFFPSFNDGPERGRIICYRNSTAEHAGVLTFERVGILETESGQAIPSGTQAGGWFPSLAWVKDWDDQHGSLDALVGSNNRCWLYRGRGFDGRPRLAEPVALQAGGRDIELSNPRFAVADFDLDGDLDLFAGTQPGAAYLFRNVGSRYSPVFTNGITVAWLGRYLIADAHSGVSLADWTGDGLPDLVSGRFWERANLDEQNAPRTYGGFFESVNREFAPGGFSGAVDGIFRFRADAGPFTEQFQICDAVRQNSVRAIDLDHDGRMDLLAGDTDGFIWFFRNTTNQRFPIFTPGAKLQVGDQPLSVATHGGHARLALVDWNNDGLTDLIVADASGGVQLFPGVEVHRTPLQAFGPGAPIEAAGKPIQVGARASVMVCDWDNDGMLDLVLADEKGYYFCRNQGASKQPTLAAPELILFNGKPVRYVRPNLGAFVDWDGDGKKDLIAAQFENSVRFYRNIGTGELGAPPRFAEAEGITLLQAESPQMISGVEILDWNGDGDLDILTGQGHGGSGLRFYERDWLRPADKRPRVALRSVERKTP